MRPALLDRLFAPVNVLPGIGPQLARLLERAAGPLVLDVLWHLPVGLVDRRASPPLNALEDGSIVTLKVRVDKHEAGFGRRPYRVICSNETGFVTLIYFNVKGDYLQRQLPVGTERIVSGRVELYGRIPQIAHPDFVVPVEEADRLKPIEPVYPLTAGLSPRIVQRAAAAALERAPELPEWLDPALRQRRHWPAWHDAVEAVHNPQVEADLAPEHPARERLAYDEILASQLAVALVRARRRRRPGRALAGTGKLLAKAEAGFGFVLTGSQRMALAEIAGDMKGRQQMMRLLQGDVGSGKTVVALLAMLTAVESGAQAALMAPTEILARQHHATLQRLAAPAGIEIGFLSGREKGKSRDTILANLASEGLVGGIPIVVGTHALLQPDVRLRDLGLVVIDEQHRFGVEQRLALTEKGKNADTLLMSATPIPRTLMMTAYGDLDVSRLTEKPPGRRPVDTRTLPASRYDEVVGGVTRALERGTKVYWICPIVEESETADIAAAEERYRMLAPIAPGKVGLVHGRLKSADKDKVMAAFAEGGTDLLVATTVVEVGVDVPAATVMVVEHAERFGLAQLHQLRGRIGRGDQQSTCLLLYQAPLGEIARQRLAILRDTEDGFRIAEEDLRLRGAGEVLGTRQSGLPSLRLADLAHHEPLIAVAHDDARLILDRDPTLSSPRGDALRVLLYLFQRDEAIQYLRAG
ncbi:MAG TPA: ATP-dependent DNA helicase RecG [Stellaceae bacterium]|jgi:ATP-dependent DNA helicase RecG|nr:ATP-dependent DNA helicase RecG [Stellaceae bacterium]